MVDLKRLLVPAATGALGSLLARQEKEKQTEEDLIAEGEQAGATLVLNSVNDARRQTTDQQSIKNNLFDTMKNNYELLKGQYGADKEDDLALLYFKNPTLFKMNDIGKAKNLIDSYMLTGLSGDITGEGVNQQFAPAGDITGDTKEIKSIYEVYGQGATVGDIIKQQRDTYNKQVNTGLANLTGENASKLFVQDFMQPGVVSESAFDSPQYTEGRVSQEQFLTNINDIVDKATMDDLPSMNLTKMAQTVNWVPRLTKQDLDMAAFNAVPGMGAQADLLREKYKFSYQLQTAQTMMLQSPNVSTIGEAIDIARAEGRISQNSVMNALSTLDRAVLDYTNNMISELSRDPLNPDTQIINRYNQDPEGSIDVGGTEIANKKLYDDVVSRYRETAIAEYRNQGYYDLFGQFKNPGDDPRLNVKVLVDVRDNAEAPFTEKQITGSINPQVLPDGGLQIVNPKDIYETINIVDARDLFGIYSPDGSKQLVGGDSGVFSGMSPNNRDLLKQEIVNSSGGMEAIQPFLNMSQEEFEVYNKKKAEDPDVIPISINRDNYEEFLPPSKLNVANTPEPNPELVSWASENMGAWESFVNSFDVPKKENYPENEQGFDQQYGEDLRFYNKNIKNFKRQLPKIKKFLANAKDTE
jgi:hypothetical protein